MSSRITCTRTSGRQCCSTWRWRLPDSSPRIRRCSGRYRSSDCPASADPAGIPILLMTAGAVGFAVRPIVNAVSRSHERRADAYALRMTEQSAGFHFCDATAGAAESRRGQPLTPGPGVLLHAPADQGTAQSRAGVGLGLGRRATGARNSSFGLSISVRRQSARRPSPCTARLPSDCSRSGKRPG